MQSCRKHAVPLLLLCLAMMAVAEGQTFETLFNFDGNDGSYPGYGSLVQGTDGNFYGTTVYGGVSSYCTSQYSQNGCGTAFKITTSGKLTTLHNFCSKPNCADGYNPYGGLIVGTNGDLYGTTEFGGVANTAARSDVEQSLRSRQPES
jgi:uncharacterized repeat protein (TIGR03803 family)